MNVKFQEINKTLTVEITEEIDHHSVEKIRRKVDYEIQRCMPKRVIFDFNNVSFMDSSGIGMLVGRYKLVNMFGGEVGITNVKPNVKRILEMAGICKLIPIYTEETLQAI